MRLPTFMECIQFLFLSWIKGYRNDAFYHHDFSLLILYLLWTTIGKGETSHHTQTQYVHNMIASCFVCISKCQSQSFFSFSLVLVFYIRSNSTRWKLEASAVDRGCQNQFENYISKTNEYSGQVLKSELIFTTLTICTYVVTDCFWQEL